MADFNWVDYIIFGIFFFSILAGFSRGFFKEIISLVTLIIALVVAIKFATPLANIIGTAQGAVDVVATISRFFGVDATGALSLFTLGLSFFVLFMGFYLTGEAISYASNMMFVISSLAVVNQLLGGVVGFARGYIFSIVLVLLVQLTPVAQNNAWSQSQLVPNFLPVANQILDLIRSGLQTVQSSAATAR